MSDAAIRQELETLTTEELFAVKNIFEFNLRGIMVGDREEVQRKLNLVEEEINFRSIAH